MNVIADMIARFDVCAIPKFTILFISNPNPTELRAMVMLIKPKNSGDAESTSKGR